MLRTTVCAAAMLSLLALMGCATAESDSPGAPAKLAGAIDVTIASPAGGTRTTRSTVTIRGRATPGSRVRVGGRVATVDGSSFHRRVRLHIGRNRIVVRASRPGATAARKVVLVTRRRRSRPQVVAAATPTPTPTAAPTPRPTPEPTPHAASCDPSYKGACLDPNSPDYDCEGGSGNGPDYTGTVSVVGDDHFGLDADGDGVGCE